MNARTTHFSPAWSAAPSRRRFHWVFGLLLIVCAISHAMAEDRPLAGPHTDAEIQALIRDLGAPSFEKRQFATRRLCAIGPAARTPLEEAAKESDFEIALRARNLLTLLDQIMLSGVGVSLAFTDSAVDWNRSIDLVVTFVNHSQHRARLPFLDPLEPSDLAARKETDALQVGRMLDIADYLRVRRPDGSEIDLRVDDISVEPEIVAAVQKRLSGEAGIWLDAGQTVRIRVPAFNRGWARYPLLEEGVYNVSFDYAPDWEDDVLNAQRIGRVSAEKTSVTVRRSAPATISRSGGMAELVLVREGNTLIGRLVNTFDQPITLNTNYGRTAPFAWARWVLGSGEERTEIAAVPGEGDSWSEFRAERLVRVEPGESLEIARETLEELLRKLALGGRTDDPARIYLIYANSCDRHWQIRQGSVLIGNPNAPAALRDPLPRLLPSLRLNSNEISAAPD